MSCCSISKATRKLGRNIQKGVVDPVRKEASRIESKARAEAGRIPNNIDKGVSSAQAKIGSSVRGGVRTIRETAGDVFEIIPGFKAGGTFFKVLGVGLIALLVLSIARRARGS